MISNPFWTPSSYYAYSTPIRQIPFPPTMPVQPPVYPLTQNPQGRRQPENVPFYPKPSSALPLSPPAKPLQNPIAPPPPDVRASVPDAEGSLPLPWVIGGGAAAAALGLLVYGLSKNRKPVATQASTPKTTPQANPSGKENNINIASSSVSVTNPNRAEQPVSRTSGERESSIEAGRRFTLPKITLPGVIAGSAVGGLTGTRGLAGLVGTAEQPASGMDGKRARSVETGILLDSRPNALPKANRKAIIGSTAGGLTVLGTILYALSPSKTASPTPAQSLTGTPSQPSTQTDTSPTGTPVASPSPAPAPPSHSPGTPTASPSPPSPTPTPVHSSAPPPPPPPKEPHVESWKLVQSTKAKLALLSEPAAALLSGIGNRPLPSLGVVGLMAGAGWLGWKGFQKYRHPGSQEFSPPPGPSSGGIMSRLRRTLSKLRPALRRRSVETPTPPEQPSGPHESRLTRIRKAISNWRVWRQRSPSDWLNLDEPKQQSVVRHRPPLWLNIAMKISPSLFARWLARQKKLENLDFSKRDLTGVNFAGKELKNCSFDGCKMNHASFENAKVMKCDFHDSELDDVVWEKGTFKECYFYSTREPDGMLVVKNPIGKGIFDGGGKKERKPCCLDKSTGKYYQLGSYGP